MSTDPFVSRLLGPLQPLGPVRARRMFGGWGLFLDDAMIAIVARGRLYWKADAETAATFDEAGCAPFTYLREGRSVALSFREASADSLDDPESLLAWARIALPAAERALAKRRTRRRRR
jgi:DNA transformation protein